jgi:hypothetical protein
MVQQIKVLVPPVELPGGSGQITTVNAVVNLTDDDVAMISPTAFTSQPVDAHNPSGSAILQNLGFVGSGTGPVAVQAAHTTNTAVTVTGSAGTTYTTAEQGIINALVTAVNALETSLTNLLTALQVTGGAQKSS